jgi:NosR/NirI family transcriptional regulator, nitrous oxide reductase regulator
VKSLRLTRAQVEARFANTRAQGNDKLFATAPEALALDAQVALVSIPQIGRNLLDEEGWGLLKANLRGASHAFMVAESGPLAKMAYESQRVQMPVPYFLRQGGRELTLRSMAYDKGLSVPDYPQDVQAYFWLVDRATPFDPTQPFEFGLRLGRRFGGFASQTETTEFTSGYTLPRAQALMDSSYEAGWVGNWRARAWEIAVLCLGLIVLSVALARQRWLSATTSRLARFRVAYLIFTLGFIGWYAQGQLTIVNITSSLEALASGNNLSFLMGDPMTVILWGFVLVSLFIWGRGTFCGWLCPFGALQELVSMVVQRLGYLPKKLHTALDGKLKWIKYGVLAFIVVSVFAAPPVGEIAIEIEPFKTAISLYFVRDWPYVVWAVACLVLSTLVYRGYCRYICPLGAALAASKVLQRWNWIARRAECGTGCQSCRHRCEYQAIAPSGKVDYSECFQCLDCVAIYQDDKRCLPLILDKKAARKIIPLHPVEVA